MAPQTLVDIFRNLSRFQKPDLLLVKKHGAWRPISTREFMDRVQAVSSALGGLGVKSGDRVALLSENRPEWAIVDFACQCFGAVLVPIFPTMVAEQTEYLLKDSGSVVAFCSTAEQAVKVLDARGVLSGAEARHSLRRGCRQGDPSIPRGARRGAEGVRGGSGGLREAGRRAEARRSCDPDLHVGDDGGAEGGDAAPEQLRLERPRLRRAPAAPADDGGALVPSALARPRADGRSTSTTTSARRSRTRSRSTSSRTTSAR